jgi:hypothetical protein
LLRRTKGGESRDATDPPLSLTDHQFNVNQAETEFSMSTNSNDFLQDMSRLAVSMIQKS